MSSTTILLHVILGAVGMGYLTYARSRRNPVALLCGVGLLATPYAIHSAPLAAVVGVLLMIVPMWLRL